MWGKDNIHFGGGRETEAVKLMSFRGHQRQEVKIAMSVPGQDILNRSISVSSGLCPHVDHFAALLSFSFVC